ncbi:TPA: hypothetical protein G8J98_003047 [Salmonella enterica]|uniref:Uncharacterized protein n=2 Tax=Salmonella enterica TaxID=28901 RepID=A0A739U1P7_SALDE|nr:hypothetical protein [Salmonella enterica subsp. enterica serovar Derby]EDQ0198076.1 hypothetical protein [Salmonella enterica subsp. enterica serovar Fresno]EDQ8964962.1 hypothetical protein [Salmonella enterica]EDS5960560.1 hypothetical protein [Salmonella enterica subsp. enterica serovar Berta]EDU2077443.1 hypothetical protein [Salmonella enterica subsp. enterica serovar Infantis]EDU6157869.1 hypothetical protein [Salmonella enterica subsp. enterica serovar Derby str. CFSAN000564]EDW804
MPGGASLTGPTTACGCYWIRRSRHPAICCLYCEPHSRITLSALPFAINPLRLDFV